MNWIEKSLALTIAWALAGPIGFVIVALIIVSRHEWAMTNG